MELNSISLSISFKYPLKIENIQITEMILAFLIYIHMYTCMYIVDEYINMSVCLKAIRKV